MYNIPLSLLRAFAAIYETGGVRSASRILGIAHSAVSRSLRELEAFLDADLVERSEGRRILTFTVEGEKVGRAALRTMKDLDSTLNSVKRIKGRSSVVLETTPSFATRWLFPRLGQFEQELPWIELSISIDQRLAGPGQLQSDLAVRLGHGPWAGLSCESLSDDQLIAVASPDYLKSVTGKFELSKCQLLHDRDPIAGWTRWQDNFGDLAQAFDAGPRYTSGDLVLRAAERGMGVALSRQSLASESLELGTLIQVESEKTIQLKGSIWLVMPETIDLRKPVRKVAEWLRQQFKVLN
ncbi:LysR substrate-binding domain-containing protein [Yoonia sp. GPGPB17]|uniref:LysR substrate-binding domain-containing protein n=1 Tax=Yoonia sp. GPGPB17 TaxID=3026147 RepID=UPI0030C332EA